MNTRAKALTGRNLQEDEEDYEYEQPIREELERNRLSMSNHSRHGLDAIDEKDVEERMDRMERDVSKVADIEKTLRDLSTTVHDGFQRMSQNQGFSPGGMSTPQINSLSSGLQPRQMPPTVPHAIKLKIVHLTGERHLARTAKPTCMTIYGDSKYTQRQRTGPISPRRRHS